MSSDEPAKLIRNYSFTTQSNVCVLKYKWKINNFSFYSGKKLKSSVFTSGLDDIDEKWQLELVIPKKERNDFIDDSSSDDDDNILWTSLFLHLNAASSFQALYKVSLLDEEGKERMMQHSTIAHNIEAEKLAIEWDPFVSLDILFDNVHGYLPSDTLTIICEIKILTNPKDCKNKCKIAERQLSDNLEYLLASGKSSDVTLKVRGKLFNAVKGILASRSPVFNRMFEYEQLLENKNHQVIIDDIDEDVFEELLYFIYTDKSPNIHKMPIGLLAAAEKYHIDRLKNLCEDIISSSVTIDDAAEMIVFADTHNAGQLKKNMIDFIQGHLCDVVQTEGYKKFKQTHGHLFAEVLENIAGVK